MRSIKSVFAALLVCGDIVLLASRQIDPQEKEFVNVVNVVIVARVQEKGQSVPGLKKEDFILFENKTQVEINGFREIRRRISSRQVYLASEEKKKNEPRFFLLYFWLMGPDSRPQESIDYFFSHVYRDGDGVILATAHDAVTVNHKEEIQNQIARFREILDQRIRENKIANDTMLNTHEQGAERYRQILLSPAIYRPKNYQQDFQNELFSAWTEFKYKNLKSNIGQVMKLADALKAIPGEKWSLVFFQPLQYPMLQLNNNLVLSTNDPAEIEFLNKLMHSLIYKILMTPEISFPMFKNIQQAFIDANVTFHVLQPPADTPKHSHSNVFQLNPVFSDWEETFKRISRVTGGQILSGGQLREVLARVVESEDIYYELSYAPKELKSEKRAIKISIRNRDCQVFHVHKAAIREANLITIDPMTFSQPALQFRLSHFQRIYEEEKLQGHVKVTVIAIDEEGRNTEYTKDLYLEEADVSVSLKLHFPHSGKYRIVVEAFDQITKRQAVASQDVQVTETAEEEERDLLKRIL